MSNNEKETAKTVNRLHIQTWKKMLPFLRPYYKRLVLLVFIMGILAAADVMVPLFLRYAVDHFVLRQSTQHMLPFALLYAGMLVAQAAFVVWMGRVCMGVEMEMGRDLKRAGFVHLQQLGFSYYNQNAVGWILARVMSDTNRICVTVAWWIIDLFWGGLFVLGAFVSMLLLNWRLALPVIAVVPATALIIGLLQGRLLLANRKERSVNSRITGAFNEGITGAKTSKTLVIEERNCRDFAGLTGEMRRAALHTTFLNAALIPTVAFLSSVAVALVLVQGGRLEMSDLLAAGTLSAFISYALALLEPVQQMARAVAEFIGTQVNIERFTSLLETPCDLADDPENIAREGSVFAPRPENWARIRGEVEFKDVWFRYPDGTDYVLENFNLKIPAGTTVAIVGETGAGKSTLINLACRFYEPTKGSVLIDGEDVRSHSQIWLHSQLGYVLQNPHLFSGTVKENIRYGRLSASDEEIYAAARLVSADVVVSGLENGFDTQVGENGDRLSTGEKQLVSFARAMLADPPIFVLDEATSSIDTETEQLIQQSISHLLKGRTSFLVAHRLSTIRHADLILVVKAGKIIERGTHAALMAKKGYYHTLYTAMRVDESVGGLIL